MTIRVLLVDDHKVVVDGLRELLDSEEDITVVAHASDGRQAVAMAAELSPTVVVMDVTMPELVEEPLQSCQPTHALRNLHKLAVIQR